MISWLFTFFLDISGQISRSIYQIRLVCLVLYTQIRLYFKAICLYTTQNFITHLILYQRPWFSILFIWSNSWFTHVHTVSGKASYIYHTLPSRNWREGSRQDATKDIDSLRKVASHREERKTARAVQATKGNEKGMETFKDNKHYHQSAKLYDEGKGSMRYDNAKVLEKGEHENQQ